MMECTCDKRWNAAKQFFWDQLAPQIGAFLFDKTLSVKITELEKRSTPVPDVQLSDEDLEQLLELLKTEYATETVRKDKVNEKGRAALLIIGVVISLMTSGLTFVDKAGTNIFESMLLLLALISLVMSAFTVLHALNIRKHFRVFLDIIEQDDGRLAYSKPSTKDQIGELYISGKLNELIMSSVANHVYATYVGIRNGVFFLSCYFVLAFCRVFH